MAIYIGGTPAVDAAGHVDWSRISNKPAGLIAGLSVTTSGDGTSPLGTNGSYILAASLSNETLALVFNTNCNCDCACMCACACGNSGGGNGGGGGGE